MQLTWILVIALVLLSLFTFISCADDIVGIRIQDDKEPDAPDDDEQDPNSGGGGGMVLIPPDYPLYVRTIPVTTGVYWV